MTGGHGSPAPHLAQTLRTRHIVMISLGGVIGAGFFVGSSGAIATAGPAVVITYALAGLMILLVNLMLRDVACHAPGHGSFITQIRFALGERVGFVAGWTYWLIWVTTLAVEVMGAASLLTQYVHVPYVVLECAVLAAMTAINLASVRGYGEFEYWFSIIKVGAIAIFIGVGVYVLAMGIKITTLPHLSGGLFPNGITALFGAVPTVVFSMSGSEIATIAALESPTPDQNIARVACSVAFRIVGFYLTSIVLLLSLISWRDVVPGQSPFLLVLDRLHIPFAEETMAGVILVAMLSTLNSGLYAASRVLFEMAEGGDAPNIFVRVGRHNRTPGRAVVACAAATVLIASTAVISPSVVFAFMVSVTGAFIIFDDILIVLARLRLSPAQPWKAYLTLVLLIGVLFSMLLLPQTRHELALSAAALFAIVVGAYLSIGTRRRLREVTR